MPSFWKRMRDRFSPPQKEVGAQNREPDRAHREPADSDRASNTNASAGRAGYPNTFQSGTGHSQETDGARIFDPALKHFAHAFRLGDPAFADPETRERWQDSRRQVIDHLLQIVTGSPWNDHLVLRGSLLLKAWLG